MKRGLKSYDIWKIFGIPMCWQKRLFLSRRCLADFNAFERVLKAASPTVSRHQMSPNVCWHFIGFNQWWSDFDIVHRDCSISIERDSEWDKMPAWLYYIIGIMDIHSTYKKIMAVCIKHSSFWASAFNSPFSAFLLSISVYFTRQCFTARFVRLLAGLAIQAL